MIEPALGSDSLLAAVKEALGLPNERRPLIIGIDGRCGAGKTSVACWLGWQLGMPVISLDLYLVSDTKPQAWRYAHLARVLASRAESDRPVIVEGVCLCQVLEAIDLEPGFLGWVENAGGPERSPNDPSEKYVPNYDPIGNADHKLCWRQPMPTSECD